MSDVVILLSIPGLRGEDMARMPALAELVRNGDHAPLVPSFPAVTWPVQANMLTGETPDRHGVIANGFFWRQTREVEMWTASNDRILCPQIWDILHQHDPELTSAVWFPMLSKGCGADFVCMPAPVHNPDGTESLWCYTRPSALYGDLMAELGHFPLKHFWGPLANIESSRWIARSAVFAAQRYLPRFFFIYLPHLDYAAQKDGPDSESAIAACRDLDGVLAALVEGMARAYSHDRTLWLVASEYTIVPVSTVTYPNRILRQANLLALKSSDSGRQLIDLAATPVWALVDHQFSHVFVKDQSNIGPVVDLFRGQPGIAEVLAGSDRDRYSMNHERSGEVILISNPDSWQAYYWWKADENAPEFARTVDIHQKPGYDPVELHFDFTTRSIPLDATLIKGSHGAPAVSQQQRGVLLTSEKGVFAERPQADIDVCDIVLRQFGI
jgi:predicted AlkP superfamily pyrophosphatase or phosphodiesterase